MSADRWMIYGANGYTARLTAAAAVRRGLTPVLAGRNAEAVQQIAAELGLESRIFSLQQPAVVVESICDCRLALHCAGPFSVTSQPMIAACLSAGVHYLDITGEISVFANAHQQAEPARRADVVLIPGVGFDVAPLIVWLPVWCRPCPRQRTSCWHSKRAVGPVRAPPGPAWKAWGKEEQSVKTGN